MTMRRPRLAVGVVSAGRVGSVLGAALARAGHSVVAAAGISADSVRRAEELLPGVPLLPPDEVVRRADLVILALPDDALAGTVKGLVATDSLSAGKILVHTSGAHGVDVLRPAAERDVLCLALHPAMTFTGRAEDLERLSTACVGVTAPDDEQQAASVGSALAVEMGAEPIVIPEAARPLYHAALTHGANHLMTLVADCLELLRGADIDNADRLMAPLLSAALDNALRRGDRALTGPVARGDAGTVDTHLRVLGEHAPEVLPSYATLARRTATRAARSGLLRADAVADIDAALDGWR